MTTTRILRTADDFKGLSFFTLSQLASATQYENPKTAIPARGEVWALDVDGLGNFVRAECLGLSLTEVVDDGEG